MPTTKNLDMSVAESEIKDLCAAHIFTFAKGREAAELRQNFSQMEKEMADKIAAKGDELRRLQTCVDDKDAEIRRSKGDAQGDREAKEKAIRERKTACTARSLQPSGPQRGFRKTTKT